MKLSHIKSLSSFQQALRGNGMPLYQNSPSQRVARDAYPTISDLSSPLTVPKRQTHSGTLWRADNLVL